MPSGEPTDRSQRREKAPIEATFRKELDARISLITNEQMDAEPGVFPQLVAQGAVSGPPVSRNELRRLATYQMSLGDDQDASQDERFVRRADLTIVTAYLKGQVLVPPNVARTFRSSCNARINEVSKKQMDAIAAVLPELYDSQALPLGEATAEIKRLATLQAILMMNPPTDQYASLFHSIELEVVDALLRAEVTKIAVAQEKDIPMPPAVMFIKGWQLLILPDGAIPPRAGETIGSA